MLVGGSSVVSAAGAAAPVGSSVVVASGDEGSFIAASGIFSGTVENDGVGGTSFSSGGTLSGVAASLFSGEGGAPSASAVVLVVALKDRLTVSAPPQPR